jgi:hypothetical protein
MTPFEQQTFKHKYLKKYEHLFEQCHVSPSIVLWSFLQNHSRPIYKTTRILLLESHDALCMTQIAMCLKFSTINKMHRMYTLQLTNYKSRASTIGAKLNCDDNKNVATCCHSFTTYKFQTSTQANNQSHACNNKVFVNLTFGHW